MSTPDQPESTPLTRRRLREIRATGATPIITPDEAAEAAEAAQPDTASEAPSSESEAAAPTRPEPAPAPAPLPRAAAPAPVSAVPLAEADVDLGVSPLTRRQARAQERIRTASVPIIQPDAPTSPPANDVASEPAGPEQAAPPAVAPADDDVVEDDVARDAPVAVEQDRADTGSILDSLTAAEQAADEPESDAAEPTQPAAAETDETDEPAESIAVNPELGSELLAGETPRVTIPPSFDQLIARSSSATGSVSTPNALILSQTPTAAPLGPLSSTGEVLITGSFDLPAGFGSVGHAEGAADGKELDAALIDGELPPSSSPTPIAASAAISTARNSGEEIIRPPAPEKGNKLMLALVITAGALAAAVVGVLILAVTTGVFS
jgi:hypothetical protein